MKAAKIPELVQYFSTVGIIKEDRTTKRPRLVFQYVNVKCLSYYVLNCSLLDFVCTFDNRVWLYTDKVTGQATGEATITYTSAKDQVAC